MSSTKNRGFRLPWAAERSPDETGTAVLDDAPLDRPRGEAGDDLGEGPFRRPEPASETTDMTTDADPAAPDVPEPTAEAAMMETQTSAPETSEATGEAGPAEASHDGSWPTMDRPAAPAEGETARPPIRAVTPGSPARRENPLVAGLVKAMREAAVASRAETTSRLQAEATARVDAIRTDATNDAAELRKRVDEDIAGIREWSKGEMARIRQETDERIEARRTEAIAESQRHQEGIDALVERVQTTVTAYEADMDTFFTQLLAETDPARLAALAEQAPEPPDLTAEGMAAGGWDAATAAPTVLEADAAAEAEAEATEGLDLSAGDDTWPAALMAAARRGEAPEANHGPEPEGNGHSRLLVSGLTSVAGISAFKGAVGQLPGIHSVSVSSGERGVFIFTVSHDPQLDMAQAVAGLGGFAAQITDESGDELAVTAHEPAA